MLVLSRLGWMPSHQDLSWGTMSIGILDDPGLGDSFSLEDGEGLRSTRDGEGIFPLDGGGSGSLNFD